MAGNSSVTGLETITFTDNMSFDGTKRGGAMTTNGELFIGSTSLPHIRKGFITSPLGTISIGYSAPNITLDLNGGGQSVQHLTGDTGGQLNPTANNFNIYGKKAGSVVQVMEVDGTVSTLSVENRTWQTQYVVDTVTTPGLRGTFSSIQAAINQGVADGKSINDPINIFVRSGVTDSTNITFPDSVLVNIAGESLEQSFVRTSGVAYGQPTVSGTITFTSTSYGTFDNLNISNAITLSSPNQMAFSNCSLLGGGTFTGGSPSFTNCFMAGDITYTGNPTFTNCEFASLGKVLIGTAGLATLINCSMYQVNLSSTSGIRAINCTWISSVTSITGSGNGTIRLYNCTLGTLGIDGAFSVYISQVGTYEGFTGNLLENTGNKYLNATVRGNLNVILKTATDYTVLKTDQYIGVTSTASARIITLPNTVSSALIGSSGQIWTIKDESGGAGTNNITITPNGGTIDGSATFVINQNYGSADVMFDGTNYFLI